MKQVVLVLVPMYSAYCKGFAMTDGYEVCLCDIKQEFVDGGKAKILKKS